MPVLQFIPKDLREELIEEVKAILQQRAEEEQKAMEERNKSEVSDLMKDFLADRKQKK